MSTISSPGIGSRIDVNAIVDGLVGASRGPIDQVDQQKSTVQAQLSAFGMIKNVLSAFQTSLSSLSTPDKFMIQTAKSSDDSIFTATANGKAVPATYNVNVTQIAQSHKLATDAFATTGSPVGTGQLSISFGSYDSGTNTFTPNAEKSGGTITIDANNNSLSGIRDAINAKKMGVTASIVNDGTGNRLVISSDATGEKSSLKIAVTDGDGNSLDGSGLSRLAYDPTQAAGAGKNLSQTQAAKDALLDVDGIALRKQSNTIDDALEGISFKLIKPGTSGTLTVSRDDAKIEASVESFVKAYNDLNRVVRDLSSFKGVGAKQPALLGDSIARSISSAVRNELNKTVGGIGTIALSDIGVSFQKDGSLLLDKAKLGTALANDSSSVAKVFAANGTSADSLVSVSKFGDKTVAGTYAVNVTQLATQATLGGTQTAGLAITAGVNDEVTMIIDNVSYSVKIAAGTYGSPAALATELQSKLSGAGAKATVTEGGGVFTVTSYLYGSGSSVQLVGGNGAADMFGAGTSTNGLDVAGTINGVAATGSGQTLKGAAGSLVEGLELKVDGGGTGARGSVTFSTGYAYTMAKISKAFTDTDGILEARTKSLNERIKSYDDRRAELEKRLMRYQEQLLREYTALDKRMSQMDSISGSLAAQLGSLPKIQ